MEQTPEQRRIYVYCGGKPHYRRDPQGQGLFVWCRGHHNERLVEWDEMDIPVEELRRLLAGLTTR